MRALFVALLLLGASGCRTSNCKDGTLFVELTLPPGAVGGTATITVNAAGREPKMTSLVLPAGRSEGGIEIDFESSYPSPGTQIDVQVTVTKGGMSYQATTTLVASSGCSHVTLSLEAFDMGADLAVPDLATPPDLTSGDLSDADIIDASPPVDLSAPLLDLTVVPDLTPQPDLTSCVPNDTDVCTGHYCGSFLDNCQKTVSCGPCELYSASVRYASQSGTVDLEGVFDTGAVVNLPDGQFIGVNNTTPVHRITGIPMPNINGKTVPTRGVISVTSGKLTTNSVPFGITSYQNLFQSFSRNYAQTSVARAAPTFSSARAQAASAVVGNIAYVVGGTDGTTVLGTLERAAINADGTLGGFGVTSSSLNTARVGHKAIVIGNYLYVVGGKSSGSLTTLPIESAPINMDGSLGTFVTGSTTTVARYGSAIVVVGNWLYVIGGLGSAASTVERAPINTDSTLGSFVSVSALGNTLVLPETMVSPQAYVVGTKLVVTGGCGSLNTYALDLDSDGNPTDTFTAVSTLPSDACGAVGVRLDGHYYLIGGGDDDLVSNGTSSSAHDNVLLATANSSTVGTFVNQTMITVPDARLDAVGFTTPSGFYVCGGATSTGSTASCYVAQTNREGKISDFSKQSVGTVVNGGAVFAAGNNVYFVGTGSTTIYQATVTNETMGVFSAYAGSTLGTSRQGPAVMIEGNTVYVIGGYNTTNGVVTTAESASLDINGTLGHFGAASTQHEAMARMDATSAVVAGSVYIDGGETAPTGGTVVTMRDSASTTGGLGAFTSYNGGTNTTDGAGVVIDNTFYIMTNAGSLESATANPTTLTAMAAVSPAVSGGAYSKRASVLVGPAWYLIGGNDTNGVAQNRMTGFLFQNDKWNGLGGPNLVSNAAAGVQAIAIGNDLWVIDATQSEHSTLQ